MPIYTYAFDRSGAGASNLIAGEVHVISSTSNRLLILAAGLFYLNNFTVINQAGGIPLVAGTDFRFIAPDDYITATTGLSTAGGIELADNGFTGTIEISYQAVGGPEGTQSALLHEIQNRLNNQSTGLIPYADLINIPTEYPPEPHLHSVVNGLTELDLIRNRLDGINTALTENRPLGTSVGMMDDYINRLLVLQVEQRAELRNILVAFNNSGANYDPRITALEIAMGIVQNRLDAVEIVAAAGGGGGGSNSFAFFVSNS